MCEMYVRTEDRVNKDSIYLDAKCYKRGDVVVIVEDGWKWGEAELNNGAHTIVQVPGVPAEKMTALLAAEPGDPVANKLLQRRVFKFDIDTHEANQKKPDAKPLTEVDALALKVAKPVLVDPDVLGDPIVDIIGP